MISDPFWSLIFYVMKHTHLICVATWGPTKVFMLYSIFWLPKLEPRQNVFYFIFYTQVPFLVLSNWNPNFSIISQFQNSNVRSVQIGVLPHLTCVPTLANKTIPCPLVSDLPWDILPPPPFICSRCDRKWPSPLTSQSAKVSPLLWPVNLWHREVTGSHIRLMIKFPISFPFVLFLTKESFPHSGWEC